MKRPKSMILCLLLLCSMFRIVKLIPVQASNGEYDLITKHELYFQWNTSSMDGWIKGSKCEGVNINEQPSPYYHSEPYSVRFTSTTYNHPLDCEGETYNSYMDYILDLSGVVNQTEVIDNVTVSLWSKCSTSHGSVGTMKQTGLKVFDANTSVVLYPKTTFFISPPAEIWYFKTFNLTGCAGHYVKIRIIAERVTGEYPQKQWVDDVKIIWYRGIKVQFYLPIVLGIGLIGLALWGLSPLYIIYKVKHGDYEEAFARGAIMLMLAFSFTIAWLWS